MTARFALILLVHFTTSAASADVTEFTDPRAWQNATGGAYSTVGFAGFADGTPISNQYQSLDVSFTPPVFVFTSAGFINDGWGLHGPAGMRFTFDSPQNWVAIDHPGVAQFKLFDHGELIYTSELFFLGGFGNFSGIVSDRSFNEVYIFKPLPYENQVFVDDLHWGAPVPSPGAMALIGIACLTSHRRRRP